MKKNVFYLIMLISMSIFCYSCNDDDDSNDDTGNPSEITATDIISTSSKIVTVEAELPWQTSVSNYGWSVIADALYQSNGFTMNLPEILEDKYLFPISDKIPSGITISDKSVKMAELNSFNALDKNDNEIGEIIYASVGENNGVLVSWIYVDKDVTINGQYKEIDDEDEDIYEYNNCTLKKGWNIAYQSITRTYKSVGRIKTHTMLTQKPSGVNLKWHFELDDN